MLEAGAARRVINPPLGTGKGGLRLFGDPIQAIESDLTATVLVLADGAATVAVVALDLCTMTRDEARGLRAAVGEALDTPTSHVLLNLSHNHSSPTLPWHQSMIDTPAELAVRERYERDLTRRLVEAALEARGRLQPARLGSGWGRARSASTGASAATAATCSARCPGRRSTARSACSAWTTWTAGRSRSSSATRPIP